MSSREGKVFCCTEADNRIAWEATSDSILVPQEWIVMMEDKEPKWLAKVIMVQVEIAVLNMVLDLLREHIVIDYLGCWHCLLVLFMDLSKR
jgi:hypothetical protein